MFAQARESGIDLVELCDEMTARKEELMPQAKSNSLPEAQLTAVRIAA